MGEGRQGEEGGRDAGGGVPVQCAGCTSAAHGACSH